MTSLTHWARPKVEPVLRPFALALGRTGLAPNHLTFAAFVCGLAAVYFLLENWTFFVIFGIAHLVLDIMDGALARANGRVTERGRFFDFWSDRTIEILMLAKLSFYPNNVISNPQIIGPIAIVIGFISYFWYYKSKRNVPVLFSRSLIIIIAMIKLPSLAIPVALIVSSLSLIWQIWYLLNNL
ncbi:MAG TPA: CDP-alcohol phosphatidyltransferase family protein [Candidatus Nanoarchaeia archaeon]|nr:CDP-alcohol phosphatidyltransferase family protein [Candidatus Nanoarchaeia archaeon]